MEQMFHSFVDIGCWDGKIIPRFWLANGYPGLENVDFEFRIYLSFSMI